MAKILKNTTGAAITITEVGLTIPASSSYTASPSEYYLLAQSTSLTTYINAGSIVINDGYDDLKKVNAVRHIGEEGLTRPSAFLATGTVLATTNSTLALTASSNLVLIFTGTTAGQIIKLPDATTLQNFHRYEIWNTSTTSITVQNGSSTSVFVLAAAQKTWVTLQSNAAVAGTWLFEANFLGGTGGGNGTVLFGFDGTASTGRWLETITNVASNSTPLAIAGSKAIRALSLAVSASATTTITIFKNGVTLDSISVTAATVNSKLNLNHILVDKDKLSAQTTSGSSSKPIVVLWL